MTGAEGIDYSFLVQTRNNWEELVRSIDSIRSEAPTCSEVVVVDGSDVPFGEEPVRVLVGDERIRLTYALDERLGVYNAINVGIRKSSGRWLIVITAGDSLETGAKAMLESIRNSGAEVVVFSQNVIDQDGRLSYQFFPTEKSAWPHQSVIIRREVHERLGFYPTEFRYAACQCLFAHIRTHANVQMRREIFSTFRLGGLTSGASLRRSREIFAVHRRLGHGYSVAVLHGYVYPYIRFVLERIPLFRGVVRRLRRMVYREYQQIPGS